MTYSEFYGSAEWKAIRDSYLRSKGGLCERCYKRGQVVPAQIVHHKKHLDANTVNDPELALNMENLEALCWSCHEQEHQRWHKHKKPPKRYTIDAYGKVTAVKD